MVESEAPNEAPYLTPDDFRRRLAEEVQSLDPDVRPTWERYALRAPMRMRHTWTFLAREVSGPVWIIARAGTAVLGYDEFEEAFGIGAVGFSELPAGGVVDNWGTFGERLRWTLLRFPDPAAFIASQAV